MVPTSAGRDERRFPDKLSSLSEVMSHKAKGNSDSALFDRLRLLSLQNLERVRRTLRKRGKGKPLICQCYKHCWAFLSFF